MIADADEADGVAVVTLSAQRTSRRILSRPTFAVSWAWNRWFMSVSDFDAEMKTVVSPVMTRPMITITVSISTSV